jgi:hypothetical protein
VEAELACAETARKYGKEGKKKMKHKYKIKPRLSSL